MLRLRKLLRSFGRASGIGHESQRVFGCGAGCQGHPGGRGGSVRRVKTGYRSASKIGG
jgi:hypothetical protein